MDQDLTHKRGPKPQRGESADVRVMIRLTEAEAAHLDAARGDQTRSEFMRALIAAAEKPQK